MKPSAIRFCLLAVIFIIGGCANITAPTGGKKDVIPPKLLDIDPPDSLLNTKVKRIEMDFDEYITVTDASKEVELSPLLSIQPTVTGLNKRVVVKIVDSLLEDSTTYRLSFGKAIKDLHEGNVFAKYVYTFSTGPYFDSLAIDGNIIDAATGMPDTGSILVELYSAKESDSAVVRHKPKYITKADNTGYFSFKGLPHRSFRLYAVKDMNGNMVYDGPVGGEQVAFINSIITPGDTAMPPILMKLFPEKIDTSVKNTDTTAALKGGGKSKKAPALPAYTVGVDTSTVSRRTYDITMPINILFRDSGAVLNKDKITLAYDSAGVGVKAPVTFKDSLSHKLLRIFTAWQQDKVYTLRLVKGFAKDTAGKDIYPSRYTFRTKEEEDYGKITVHLPSKYYAKKYILMATADNDTIYNKPVTDTMVDLSFLRPGTYRFSIIIDANGNGKWDTGDLFAKLQPEDVIPYPDKLTVKAGYEYIVDDWNWKPPLKKAPAKDKAPPVPHK